MDRLNEMAKKQAVPLSEIVLDFNEVISGLGPTAFTMPVLAEMMARTGQTVTWVSFHNLPESKPVGGVLVLIIEACAAGQGPSDSGIRNAGTALVKHHFHASRWPMTYTRYI